MRRSIVAAGIVCCLGFPLLGCPREEGPAERAGRALDDAAENLRDLGRDEGALEKAGRKADEAIEEVKEAFED